VVKITLAYILLIISCFAESEQELPRFSSDREAWLENDVAAALASILPQAKSPDASVVTLYNTGYLFFLQGDNSKSFSFLQQALQKDLAYPYSYLILSRIYKQSGNALGAITQLKRGLKYHPDNYRLLIDLGEAYQLLGDLDQAEQTYLHIVDKYEEKIEPRIALSSIYRSQNRLQEAKEILDNNDSLYPECTLLIEKAHVYRALGNHKDASNVLIQMCQDYPNSQWIQAYRDTLRNVYNISEVAQAVTYAPYKYKLKPGESLEYKVKYGFITLGWLKIHMKEAVIINGKTVYPIIFYIDSNPSFDFMISLHHIYESYIEAESLNAIRTRLYTEGDEIYLARVYNFDYDQSRFQALIIYSDGRFAKVEKDLPSMAQDGTSMLYFARGIVSNNSGGSTTVVIDEEYKFGHITFLNEREEIDVRDEEVQATKIFARAEFKGIAGMNGDAWGWFSVDGEFVPLKGKVKILLGSITVSVDDEEKDE
jgi:tetratricopeptide (TPR) repeat protein